MNKENLYRAIGNINDKYIVSVRKIISSENDVSSDTISSMRNSLNERTIEVDIIRNKKRAVKLIVIAALIVVTAAAAAVLLGTKKDKNEYKEKIITNYFREDEEFTLPDSVLHTEQLAGKGEDIYFSGYMTMGEGGNYFASVYSIAENKKYDIDITGYEKGEISAVSISDSYIWLLYTNEENQRKLLRADRITLKITDFIELSGNEWPYEVTQSEDGTFLIKKYILDDEITDYYFSIYDKDLKMISERNIIDKTLMSEDGTLFKGVVIDDDDDYYTLYSDENDNITLYKYTQDGELLYSRENINLDLEGTYQGAFIAKNGEPVVYSQSENTSDLYFYDELDSQTGEVSQRYEVNLEGDTQISTWCNFIRGKTPGEYDFSYISGSCVYGCRLEDEESTLIKDLSALSYDSSYPSGTAISEKEILYTRLQTNESESGEFICKSDLKGNILKYLNTQKIEQNINVRKIRIADNGDLWILASHYNEETNLESFFIVNTDKDLNFKKRIDTDCGYSDDFLADEYGRIALYDNNSDNRIIFYDEVGNRIFTGQPSSNVHFFSSDGEYFAAEGKTDSAHTSIYKIDFDNKKLKEINTLDYSLNDAFKGSGKYEICFSLSDGIYGYSVKDNKSEELLNWIDSDIDYQGEKEAAVLDDDTMVYRYYSFAENRGEIKLIRRVSDDVLKKIQERKVINVAATLLNEDTKLLITEFNKTNENYRIHLDDYSKYSNCGTSGVSDSGLSVLEQEIIKGSTPDMIIFGEDFDMIRYAGFDAFTDIDELLSGSEFNREDYFENIINAYRVNEKQYAVPLSFSLYCLSGKKSVLGDMNGITVSELTQLGKEKSVFYKEPYYMLIDYLINYDINEYVDFENFTCSFDNKKFTDLLEFIKNNGVTAEEYNNFDNGEWEKYGARIADNICLLMPGTIYSFSDLKSNEQCCFCKEEAAYIGLPSDNMNNVVINPNYSAAVFTSSQNKEGVTEFLKCLLSDDGQYRTCKVNRRYMQAFSVKKSVYNKLFEEARTNTETIYSSGVHGDSVKIKNPDSKDLETINSLIASASKTSFSDNAIRKIIYEQTDLYFTGNQSAEETAKNIQKKVSLYLKEIK